jgi:pyruvate kinase
MRTLPNPIRAEISDLYNTILQGIDCLLLTAEIISGNYPYEVVDTINEICLSCEKRVDYSNLFLEILYKTKKPMKIVEAVASSTVKTSFNLQTPFIVCVTEKGTASKMVAKYR